MAHPETAGRRANRLIHEKSPYLLQHAYNPVEWYPWGTEALAKAKQDDKPVFLSIGYSTCYWCHVMEQESFENPEIARLINNWFVAVKVDREERPDLDAIYMTAVQAMTGQGGWPMTVILTPDGKPFWGGTYFPPEERGGRPGLKTILPAIAQAWRTRRDEMLRSGESLAQAIQAGVQPSLASPLTVEILRQAAAQYAQQYDPAHGGFGSAPKFPRPHSLSLLLRVWTRTKDARTLAMVEGTLQAMARGGIHDHVGGGFHRYATDERWLIPHFEKMLYDQALIARAYLEAYQVAGRPDDASVARDVFEYALRDLRDPQGAFYSAEDAGEVGKEGEFYGWTPEGITQALGAEDAARAGRLFGVTPDGNFSATQHGGSANQFGGEHGLSILAWQMSLDEFAKQEQWSVPAAEDWVRGVRAKLLAARSRRPRPHRDDKILADWNGLMIASLAYGGRVLDEPRYTRAAAEAADFILAHMERDGRLLHRYRDGDASIDAFLDDYAFLAWGLMELYEATFETRWLEEAKRITQEMVRLFWDQEHGGFFFSGAQNERLIAQTKELYDGALPSGNSVAALDLVRLAQLLMDQELQQHADRLVRAFSGHVSQAPHAFPQFLIAVDDWLGPAQEIVISGNPDAPETRRMMRLVQSRWLPRAVVIRRPADGGDIVRLVPFVKEQLPLGGRPTAYVCERGICQLPMTDPEKLAAWLDRASSGDEPAGQ